MSAVDTSRAEFAAKVRAEAARLDAIIADVPALVAVSASKEEAQKTLAATIRDRRALDDLLALYAALEINEAPERASASDDGREGA